MTRVSSKEIVEDGLRADQLRAFIQPTVPVTRHRGALLFKTNLEDADLTGADLSRANCHRVQASRARFDQTKLDETFFRSVTRGIETFR